MQARTHSWTRLAAAVSIGLFSAACASTSASVGTNSVSAYEMAVQSGEAFTVTVMRAGSPLALPEGSALAELTRDHQAFVEGMFDDGFLLSSGPLVAPRSDTSLRGFFFLDAADPEAAQARVCEDPATEAGVFMTESMPFICRQDLRAVPPIERGFRMQRGNDEMVVRPYVAVTVETSVASSAVMDQLGEDLIFCGDVTGGSMEGQSICILDCTSVAEARAAINSVTSAINEFTFHPWVSSTSLAELN
ncbi:MAG: YciI family protein [Planctomycetota bacterium]